MKNLREYTALGCNDRMVIMAATLRRALQEMHRLGDGEMGAARYSGRSFQALHGYICSARAGYRHYASRKIRDRLMDDIPDEFNIGTLHGFMLKMVKAGIDHVGSVRVGVSLAAEIAERCLYDLIDANEELEGWETVEISEALGLIAGYLPVADGILAAAVSKYLSEIDPAYVGRAFEVFSHDATAPVIMIAPSAPILLISPKEIGAQMNSAVQDFVSENLPDFADSAVAELIAAQLR